MHEPLIEIDTEETRWRFDRSFLTSNWTCIYGEGCLGIEAEPDRAAAKGCCSIGAHLGDDDAAAAEALNLSAYADTLSPAQWQYHGVDSIFADEHRRHTRVIDGGCVFLNRPGFVSGPGCALHLAAIEAGESPIDWKPSVCWQLPIRVDWESDDDGTETATVRRWSRADWGDHADTMAWCCTETTEGGEAFCGPRRVVDSMADEVVEIVGEEVMVELRRALDR